MDSRNKYVAHTDDYEGVVPFLRITRDALVRLDATLIGFDDDIFGALKDYIEASADTYDEVTKRIVQN